MWNVTCQETLTDDHLLTVISQHESAEDAQDEADKLNESNRFIEEYYFVRRAE